MLYYNVDKNLNYVLSNDKKFNKDDLIKLVINELKKSELEIISIEKLKGSLLKIIINIDNQLISVITFIKNITGAGWIDKPKIKRVQVANVKFNSPEHLSSNENSINLIMGFYNFDDNPIIVCWDPYRYLKHKTNRSCYVTVDSIKRGYIKEYHEGVDSSQKIWIFKGEYSKVFFSNYLVYLNSYGGKLKNEQ